MNVIDQPQVVVAEEEGIWCEAEDRAGATVDTGFSALHGEEAGDEIGWLAVGGVEANNFIAGADVRVAGAVQGDEEIVG